MLDFMGIKLKYCFLLELIDHHYYIVLEIVSLHIRHSRLMINYRIMSDKNVYNIIISLLAT